MKCLYLKYKYVFIGVLKKANSTTLTKTGRHGFNLIYYQKRYLI